MKKNKLFVTFVLILFFFIHACAETEENGKIVEKKDVFVDVTEQAGLSYVRDSFSQCWGDIDEDGLPDLFVINHLSSPPSLFRNNGDGTFTDITSDSGLETSGDLHGCAIGDYDNDGDEDIYVTLGRGEGTGLGANRLYQKNGEGKFIDIAVEAGVDYPTGRGRTVSWVDYNNDGLLDLFVANAKRDDSPSVLFRNNGDGTFSDVSIEAELNIVDNAGRSSWIDYNNDGFMDLTILRARNNGKHLIEIYRNIQGKTFNKVKTFYGWTYAWGDYDNDGDSDILVSISPMYYMFREEYEFSLFPEIFHGFNRLYENVGEDQFIDVTDNSGVRNEKGGDNPIFFDYDNDGDLDIYLLISGTRNKNINDIVLENNGDKTFTNVTEDIGLFQRFAGRGRGVAYADYDNDGYLDLFLTNGLDRGGYRWGRDSGPYVLYKNQGSDNHWLKIKLIGTVSNRNGLGARIKLDIGRQLQYRQNSGGMEGYVQHGTPIHFGVGKTTNIDKIEIVWPSGISTNLTNIKSDQTLTVREK